MSRKHKYNAPDTGYGNSEVKKLPAEKLVTVDYQRPINKARVKEIVERFDPDKVNIIKVSARGGMYYVIDGAHTLAALKQVNGGDRFDVLCRVYRDLTYEQEADLFASQYDGAKKVPFKYELRARLASGNPDYVMFARYTELAGLKLAECSHNGRDGVIAAVEKAWNIYVKYGPAFYEDMLKLVNETWHGASWSLHGCVLGGVAAFMSAFPDFSRERFIRNLKKAGIDTITRNTGVYGRKCDSAFGFSIAKLYNAGGGRGTVDPLRLTV